MSFSSKKAQIFLGAVLLMCFFFPVLGLFFLFAVVLSTRKFTKQVFFTLSIFISFCVASVAFNYNRTNATGDVYQYEAVFNWMKYLYLAGDDVLTVYHLAYSSWTFLHYICFYFELPFDTISFVSFGVITLSLLLTMYSEYERNGDRWVFVLLVFKIFLFFNFYSVFSSYRNLLAFCLTGFAIFYLKGSRFRFLLLLISLGIHPASGIPIVIWILSKRIKFKRHFVPLALLFAVAFKIGLEGILSSGFQDVPLLGPKIASYLIGQWSQYRFHEPAEYVILAQLFLFSLFLLFGCLKLDSNGSRVLNFSLLYIACSFCFLGFRTLAFRLVLSGFIFSVPVVYSYLKILVNERRSIISYFLALFFIFLVNDFRVINAFNNASYVIGGGFPINIFESIMFRHNDQ